MVEGNRTLVERIFQDAEFIQSLGIGLTGSGKGWCETRLDCARSHRQQHGFIHAGVVMTLADHTCGGAAASAMAEDRDVITVENKVSFLRPAAGQSLTCRAEVLRAGKNIVFVEAQVMIEGTDGPTMVAKASSTLRVIPRQSDFRSGTTPKQ
ncbi:MAG TPA: PaaI family thioesterase [Candidatus Acidoferrum sp.]|nr:PaaI family thioesterase [Candidatus Acidoferrum sp.]